MLDSPWCSPCTDCTCDRTIRFRLLAPFGGSALLISIVTTAKPVGTAAPACRHGFTMTTRASRVAYSPPDAAIAPGDGFVPARTVGCALFTGATHVRSFVPIAGMTTM